MESPSDITACIAGIVAMNEGAIADLDSFARKLEARGSTRERTGAVVRALGPWAASIGRDGAPSPRVDPYAAIPPRDEPGRYRRVGTP